MLLPALQISVINPALAGAPMSVQWKGRPLIYNGDQAVRAPFLAEQMVGEVSMHYLYVAGEAGRVC
jgi:hypothetical protein